MTKRIITFEPQVGDKVSFKTDIQFGKGPFDGSVLRLNNGIAEIGHKGCRDEWGFVIIENMNVVSLTIKNDDTQFWNLK